MEWPTRIVRTDGSTVGEGCWFATSRSMTLFCSLQQSEQDSVSVVFIPRATLEELRRKAAARDRIHHSLNRLTQSLRSPLVSNFGYWIA